MNRYRVSWRINGTSTDAETMYIFADDMAHAYERYIVLRWGADKKPLDVQIYITEDEES